mgnify:CR=1 FL=1
MDFPLTVGVETRCFRQFYHKKTTVNCWLTIRWGNKKVTNAHATLNGVKKSIHPEYFDKQTTSQNN